MKAKLIASTVKKLPPADKPYKVWDTGIPGFYVRRQPSGVMTYRFEYRNKEGVRRDYRIGRGLKAAKAREIAELLQGKIRMGVDVVEEDRQVKFDALTRQSRILRNYIEDVYTSAVSNQRTGKKKIDRIKSKFQRYLEEDIESLSRWKLNRWVFDERKKGNSEWTLKRDLADLKALLNHAVTHGVISSNPITGWTPENTEDNSRVRYLGQYDPGERQRLLAALDIREDEIREKRRRANKWRVERKRELLQNFDSWAFCDHLKPMVLVSLNTGLRRRELFELEWQHIDFETGWITVTSRTAKSKRTRHIPVNDIVHTALIGWREQAPDSTLVFPGRHGGVLDNVKSGWKRVLKLAQIKDFTWHDMRHDFATRLVMADVNIYKLRTILGHASIKQTERYAHLSKETLKDTVERLCVGTG